MASTTADTASKPLTATQQLPILHERILQESIGRVRAEEKNAALETKVAEQERLLEPLREDLSVIREKRNVLQRLVDAARNSTLADWIRFRRDSMSGGHDDHSGGHGGHDAHATPKKSSGGGGHGASGGIGGAAGAVLIGIVIVAVVVVMLIAGWNTLFGPKQSSTTTTTTITAPVAPEVVAPVDFVPAVVADPAPALAGLPDTPENRGIEMVEANCPDSLKTTTGDSFTPWDDMQYNSSFYSYELALQHNCGVTISKLSGDRTPDPSGEMTDAELAELKSLLAKKARGE